MENGMLKQEINDLKTIVANIELERDEVELKNETLERSLVLLEERLETEFKESRKSKDDFNKIQIQNDKVNEDLQLKIEDILNRREVLVKIKELMIRL